MHFEIVTHCYHYSRLLTYQLSSFMLCPPAPGIQLTVTVYHEKDDENTVSTLRWFAQQKVEGVKWNFRRIKRHNLLKRAIGRHHAAKRTKADWVWFTDADHFFLEDVWAQLAWIVSGSEHPLYFSFRTRCTHDHAVGDKYIDRVEVALGYHLPGVMPIDREDFFLSRYKKAVGASQIVRGDFAREHGYLPGKHWQKPCPPDIDRFQQCHSDLYYRNFCRDEQSLYFKPVFLQNVYRIRHSKAGRDGLVEL